MGSGHPDLALLAGLLGWREQGITTYIYTGNFQVPPPTFTGSVQNDILVMIDKVIGVGRSPFTDFRSSKPTIGSWGGSCRTQFMEGLSAQACKANCGALPHGAGKEKLGLLRCWTGTTSGRESTRHSTQQEPDRYRGTRWRLLSAGRMLIWTQLRP